MTMRVAAIIPAGGEGRRLGGERKQYRALSGEPMLLRAARPFVEHDGIERVVVALPAGDVESAPDWLVSLGPKLQVVEGGRERSDSVHNALSAIPEAVDRVLVHDAARPLVTREIIDRVLAAVTEEAGAIAALPVSDTIKEVDAERRILRTPDRGRLWRAQTPQGFPRAMLAMAHERAALKGIGATDDAGLVERQGGTVIVVEGASENLKITTRADLIAAETLLRMRAEAAAGGA